jgi:hypothetical protein
MREIVEVLLSIGIPSAGLVWYALILARREDRGLSGETESGHWKRSGTETVLGPDPDAHLGRVGTE